MIDIHAHILDGVDDGAEDISTSLELLRLAVASGTTDIIATPHLIEGASHLSWATIKEKTDVLNGNALSADIPIRVHTGAEIELNLDMLDMIENGPGDYCLAGSKYILVELPMESIPRCTDDFFYALQLRDLVPVLAHPERYSNLQKYPEILLAWVQHGILLQCNAGSFTGMFGTKAQTFAEILLDNNMVHFLGSDAHRMKNRNTDMREAVARMKTLVSELYVEQIITTNPHAILDNKVLDVVVPKEIVLPKGEKKGFWGNFFG
jgi:protein-tyrosine phosphatase